MPYITGYSDRRNLSRALFILLGAAIVGITLIASGYNSKVSAQAPTATLKILDFVISKTGDTATGANYQARVTIINTSEINFAGVKRVDYQINDEDIQLGYIFTKLAAGDTVSFAFNFSLTLGDHTVKIILDDAEPSQSASLTGADVAVEITSHRFKRGRTVEFDIEIANAGDLTATDLTLDVAWEDTPDEVSGEKSYDGELADLSPGENASLSMQIQLEPGSYQLTFSVATATVESDITNNTFDQPIDVEFVDLGVGLIFSESLGWDGEGKAIMSLIVEVENTGVDDANTFHVGVACGEEADWDCSTSAESDQIPAGGKASTELRVWLPIGESTITIFAVENEDTFRWGDANVIQETITAPVAPEQVWTIVQISQPEVSGYWSDGSANVEFEMTLANNGSDEAPTITIQCEQSETAIENCGGDLAIDFEAGVHPTVLHPTVRLPHGDTDLLFDYGSEEPKSTMATVPERIAGVQREVWECFSDTSNVGEDAVDDDQGIGCAGWDREHVTKWPVGEAIKLWSYGDAHYLKILDEVLQDVGAFLNLEIERVATEKEAQLKIHTGVARENADSTGLDCVDFGGCARTWVADDGRITASNIAIWANGLEDEKRRDAAIRSTTLHELLHSFTNIKHRHHDRTSVMSYQALNYTSIDGMDHGLFELHAHPLVEPGMNFDEVLEFIVFADELIDPPEPVELSAPALLRRTHAALMDAESFSFEVRGGWPGCRGNHDFGWAQLEAAKLLPYAALWRHFHDGNDRYYYIGNPNDWGASEWWLRRGQSWSDVSVQRVTDTTTFRAGFSSLIQTLVDINVYATDSDYTVASRNAGRVEIEVNLDEPNPQWSRGLNLEISISVHPENYQILEYEMTWSFSPRNRNSCDTYTVEARSPQYTIDFMFPDEISEDSQLLTPITIPDEPEIEVKVAIVN